MFRKVYAENTKGKTLSNEGVRNPRDLRFKKNREMYGGQPGTKRTGKRGA